MKQAWKKNLDQLLFADRAPQVCVHSDGAKALPNVIPNIGPRIRLPEIYYGVWHSLENMKI
jgi:hypothetical protein